MLKVLHAAGYLLGVIGVAAKYKLLGRRAPACGVRVKI